VVPDAFVGFFAASAGAAAALAGLLFVAVSVAPEQTFAAGAGVARRAAAQGAYIALVNAFFFSLASLVPGVNAGLVALVVGSFSLVSTFREGVLLLRTPVHGARWRVLWDARLLLLGTVVYALQCWNGAALARDPGARGALTVLAYLVLGALAVGLGRAWELLGGPRQSLIGALFERRPPEAAPGTTPDAGARPPRG
jgi:hypothetical protein